MQRMDLPHQRTPASAASSGSASSGVATREVHEARSLPGSFPLSKSKRGGAAWMRPRLPRQLRGDPGDGAWRSLCAGPLCAGHVARSRMTGGRTPCNGRRGRCNGRRGRCSGRRGRRNGRRGRCSGRRGRCSGRRGRCNGRRGRCNGRRGRCSGRRGRNLQDHGGEHGDDAQQKTSGASSERLIGVRVLGVRR